MRTRFLAALALAGAASGAAASEPPACAPREAQGFLVRGAWFPRDPATGRRRADPEAIDQYRKANARAIEYRVLRYGSPPVAKAGPYRFLNPEPVAAQAEDTSFMGLPVRLHRKAVPALKCVEADILADPACGGAAFPVCLGRDEAGACTRSRDEVYVPAKLSGLRDYDTYRNSPEISNHMFGTAIDIDPLRNPCCGCVNHWARAPKCRWKVPFAEMTDLPPCWIAAFKRHGFHWLGEDEMGDTMHFEFLGEP